MTNFIPWLVAALACTALPAAAADSSALAEQLKARYQASSVRLSSNSQAQPEGLFSIDGAQQPSPTSQSFIAGASSKRDPALAIALQFLSENSDLLSASAEDFLLKKRSEDQFGVQHFRFLRTLAGIPVADMEVIVHVNTNNSLSGVNGNIVRPSQQLIDHVTQTNIDGLIDKVQALTTVAGLRAEQPQKLRLLNAELLLFSNTPHIRWHLDINSKAQLGRYSYWLDAETGELIDVKNTLRHPIPLTNY
ncbi:hypothetical protein QWY82_19620 [Simiduia curdlanivorans]|uniref:FTP domain-containing protein n=1 Tax=Simiduia curdlanivorans TaxID=1492769 RepID=A0ABV8V2U0_9GAMM|nr:hypothetical protein [Simiduia curdlanivorans]MDN3641018.1 hypothetical protein [Simiduia curdlanivorans]